MNFKELKLYSSDNWSWTEYIRDYPNTAYKLNYYLKTANVATVVLQSTADPLNPYNYKFNLTATTTGMPAGIYTYQAKIVSIVPGEIYTIENGSISILPNLNSDHDPRDYWSAAVDTIKTIYKQLINREVTEATYNGRTFKYKDGQALLRELRYAESRAENQSVTPVIREVY